MRETWERRVLTIHDLLSKEQCQEIIDMHDTLPPLDDKYAFWHEISRHIPKRMMPSWFRGKVAEATDSIHRHFPEYGPLVMYGFCTNRWQPGQDMQPHSDYAGGALASRHIANIFYLNDDFGGGELYIPGDGDLVIKPEAGSLVVFEGGVRFHGVRPSVDKPRYTIASWTYCEADLPKSSNILND